jgi:hypothetical protein
LTPDRITLKSAETDLCYVTVSLKDGTNENIVFEEKQITFTLEGVGHYSNAEKSKINTVAV